MKQKESLEWKIFENAVQARAWALVTRHYKKVATKWAIRASEFLRCHFIYLCDLVITLSYGVAVLDIFVLPSTKSWC